MKQKQTNISRSSIFWLMAGLFLAVLPHSFRFPPWLIGLALAPYAWKLYLTLRAGERVTGAKLISVCLFLLMILGIVAIYAEYHTLAGRDAGVALLVLMSGFKLLETARARDFYICCFLGYFMVITNFLFTQEIGAAIYMTVIIFIMTLSLLSLNDALGSLSARAGGKIVAKLLLQSLPVMLILFLLFPRIPGPLWGMPEDAHAGLTGISDEMSPGSVSNLIQSNAVAFRVDFDGEAPPQSLLYWRGPVLWHTDGVKWTRGKNVHRKAESLQTVSSPVTYNLVLEPHNKRWLYALELPGSEIDQARKTADFQLRTLKPVIERTRYSITSYLQYAITELSENEREMALHLPPGRHKRAAALVADWQSRGLSQDQIVERALRMFNEEEFYYTLNPPLLKNDRVDQFLFESKQGFCEHYANAFAVMMRAAGIPARVVLGYQGGEYNPVGDYYIVRQRNAHSWVEIWRPQRGWQRVDPTAAVAPERIIEGIESALPNDILDVPLALSGNLIARGLWQRMIFRWDALNNTWNHWVIGYGPERQRTFFSQFGLERINWGSMLLMATFLMLAVFAGMAFVLMQASTLKKDPARLLYDKFCKKLTGLGMYCRAHEGPLDFARRVALQRPDLAAAVDKITASYIAIRYGSDVTQLETFRRRVKTFRVS